MSEMVRQRVMLGPSRLDVAFAWFQRLMAAYCLLLGVFYWVRLIGIYPGALWRFDLMPMHWRTVSATLAVLFPFAAAGLWMLTSWGPVIWFICAATETVMYAGFPQLFGERRAIVTAHVLVALVYLAFRVVLHLRDRRASRETAA
ncbi:DUF6163 family protein [Mesorhizobium sp. PUT5]|uniref:DUF6163 family protein n=1 Tax=Mesorhizobium sp. PUT5 TaxID=3454629 RepID=UPI003FA4ADB1